jgi:hypothetical protein
LFSALAFSQKRIAAWVVVVSIYKKDKWLPGIHRDFWIWIQTGFDPDWIRMQIWNPESGSGSRTAKLAPEKKRSNMF